LIDTVFKIVSVLRENKLQHLTLWGIEFI